MSIIIRKADIRDVRQIQLLIAGYAKQDLMLSRSLLELYENIRDFFVVADKECIVGCCALHICWEDLAEIKSLAVDNEYKHSGLGKRLIRQAISEAKRLKVKKIFCLTYVPGFFSKFGFKKISRHKLPHKIWTECLQCPKFPNCDEQAMMLKL